MTKPDWTPENQPAPANEPLSATAMFLSAFGDEPDAAPKSAAENPPAVTTAQSAAAAPPAFPLEQPAGYAAPLPAEPKVAEPPKSAPGEFTKLFQAISAGEPQRPAAPPAPPVVQHVVPPPEPKPAPAASSQGEFTRIFLKQSDPAPAQQTPRVTPFVPPAPAAPADTPRASEPSRMKGFSSPGVSDSASAAGSFTQFFQAQPSAPSPAPAPRTPEFEAPAPLPPKPPEEFKWPSEPSFDTSSGSAGHGSSPSSATGLLASLATPGGYSAEAKPQPAQPFPSFTPAPPPVAPSGSQAGSVTRLIQQLSETVPTPPPLAPPPSDMELAEAPPPAVSTGPGEFTRMISGSAIKDATSAPAQPPAHSSAPAPAPIAMPPMGINMSVQPPVVPPMQMNVAVQANPAHPISAHASAPMPQMPHASVHAAQAPLQVPGIAPLHVPVPKVTAPAVAAPKSKLQEMLPLLLVVNTFLLIILIVVVIFAIKAK